MDDLNNLPFNQLNYTYLYHLGVIHPTLHTNFKLIMNNSIFTPVFFQFSQTRRS